MSLKDLVNEEKEKSPYISLNEDGDFFEGKFLSAEKVAGSYGDTFRYHFLVDGVEKTLMKKSWRLLKALSDTIKEGDECRVKVIGDAFIDKGGKQMPNKDRDYVVEKL